MSTVVCEDYFEYGKKKLIREVWKKAIVTLRSDGGLYKDDKLVKRINRDTPPLNDFIEQKDGATYYILQIPDPKSRKNFIKLRCLSVNQHNEWKKHLRIMYSRTGDEYESMSQSASSSKVIDDDSDLSLPDSESSGQAKAKVQNWIKRVNEQTTSDRKGHSDEANEPAARALSNKDEFHEVNNDDDDDSDQSEDSDRRRRTKL